MFFNQGHIFKYIFILEKYAYVSLGWSVNKSEILG